MKQYSYKINGENYDVEIAEICGQKAQVKVNGMNFDVEFHGELKTLDNVEFVESQPVAKVEKVEVVAEPTAPQAGTPVTSPLPGVVTKILVKTGQNVKKGDTLAVLEAMKMENNIQAENDGIVTSVCCKPGDSVMEGDTLVTIQ